MRGEPDDACVISSVHDSERWKWISEFVGSRSCVLLFNRSGEAEMFRVPSGESLHQLLFNTFGFEFYVADVDGSYLICFNHHDVRVCCGSAREWLEQRMAT